MRTLLSSLPLFGLLGCQGAPGDTADPCTPGPTPELEIGTGEYSYEDLGAAELELIHGPQGGYHVLLGLQARHLDTTQPSVGAIRGWIDGEQIGDAFPYLNWRCDVDSGAQQVWNLYLIWNAEPEEVHGETAEVAVELTDYAGQYLTAEATIHIYDPSLER